MEKLFDQVVLVDDDHVAIFINQNLLEDMQLADDIYATTDEIDALQFLKKQEDLLNGGFQKQNNILLLITCALDDLEGHELLQSLDFDASQCNIFTIVLTHIRFPSDLENTQQFNVSFFMDKPFTPEKLKAINFQF